MGKYTVYHLHSDYSLLDSCTKFEQYVDMAVEQGMTAIASTEHGKPSGWVEKKTYCDEKGIKFIHGVEIYLTEQLFPKVRDNYHTVLLAKNYEGVKELNRLIKLSSDDDHKYYNNRLSFDEFLGISDNIVKISACVASPLNKLDTNHPRYEELVKKYDYLEIQPWICEIQIKFNKRLYELSKKYKKPLIAGTDTHSANKYKAECRDILMIRKGKYYEDEGNFDLIWKTYDELVYMFRMQNAIPSKEYMQAIENTNVMADSIEDFKLDKSIKYPILYGTTDKDAEAFENLVKERFVEKLKSGVIPESQRLAFIDAIKEEMQVFKKLGMYGFMLSMSEMLSWGKRNGMSFGNARGSVGGSRVAYITDIIDLNPETWHTVFSRFANSDRLEIGDIDIDCVESERPAIFKYIIERFGEEHTARVGSFGTIQELGAIDEIGGGLSNIWEREHKGDSGIIEENPWSLKTIAKIKKEYSENADKAKAKYPKLFYYFDGLLDTKISQSVHPAGMVISPLNLEEEYGVFHKDGVTCLQIGMEELHEVGAAKYDFLVLKTVEVIRDACKNAGIPYPKSHEVNWDDEKVWEDIIRSPRAIFQMEGDYAFECMKKFKPKNLFELCLVTAVIRPSGASYREALLSRKQNKNPSKLIDDILSDSLGYLCYQESIIAFLQQVCGLSGSEADTVRRGIARKHPEILEAALPKILDGYCDRSDKPRKEAEEECGKFLQVIEDASSYMFGWNCARVLLKTVN